MEKLEALTELKGLVDKGVIKYSEYDEIQAFIMKEGAIESQRAHAQAKITELVDNGSLSPDAFSCLKKGLAAPVVNPMPQPSAPRPNPAPSYQPRPAHSSYQQKPLRGAGVGFLLGFFLNIVGLILGITLGDEDCKKHSIIWFCVSLGISVLVGIIYGIIAATAISSTYPYIATLLSIF